MCPENIEYLTVPGGSKKIKVIWKSPTYWDNSGHALATPSHKSGSVFPIGVTTVEYRVRDPASNVNTCSFNITMKGTRKSQKHVCRQWFNDAMCERRELFSPLRIGY